MRLKTILSRGRESTNPNKTANTFTAPRIEIIVDQKNKADVAKISIYIRSGIQIHQSQEH